MAKNLSDFIEIPGFPRYRISPKGEVYSTFSSRFLKPTEKPDGYCVVGLTYATKKHKSVFVHQLVAKCFLENTDNLTEVNHKDGVKSNNSVENLEWCTRQQNISHSVTQGLHPRGERVFLSKLTPVEVKEIKALRNSGATQQMLADLYGVCRTTIRAVVNGKTWRHI